MRIKGPFCAAVILVCSFCNATLSFANDLPQKPRSPLQVTITPVQARSVSRPVGPGDVVDFKVAASTSVEAPEMSINVKLVDGASLVSGSLSWTGPARQREEKELFFSVRVPKTGTGKIRARVSIPGAGTRAASQQTQYIIITGQQHLEKIQQNMKSSHPAKKDGKGRAVVEY